MSNVDNTSALSIHNFISPSGSKEKVT